MNWRRERYPNNQFFRINSDFLGYSNPILCLCEQCQLGRHFPSSIFDIAPGSPRQSAGHRSTGQNRSRCQHLPCRSSETHPIIYHIHLHSKKVIKECTVLIFKKMITAFTMLQRKQVIETYKMLSSTSNNLLQHSPTSTSKRL